MSPLRQSSTVNDSRPDAALIARRAATIGGATDFRCVREDLSWKSIGGATLSRSGQWFGYSLAPGVGDGELILRELKTDKQLSFGERRMLDTARSLIVKEIAIAREQTEEQVKTEIEAIFLTN